MPSTPIRSRALATISLVAGQFFLTAAAAPKTIDLAPYCNYSLTNSLIGRGPLNGANNLAALPSGPGAFAGVAFHVSGVVQLGSRQSIIAGRKFPDRIGGVRVDATADKIHLLHGAGWNDIEHTVIGKLVIHYAGGEIGELPIVYAKHVVDWWENEDAPTDVQTKIAWTGVNPISKRFGTSLRIYRTTFANPKPAARIESIDFVSTKKESAPFLLGLTVE